MIIYAVSRRYKLPIRECKVIRIVGDEYEYFEPRFNRVISRPLIPLHSNGVSYFKDYASALSYKLKLLIRRKKEINKKLKASEKRIDEALEDIYNSIDFEKIKLKYPEDWEKYTRDFD